MKKTKRFFAAVAAATLFLCPGIQAHASSAEWSSDNVIVDEKGDRYIDGQMFLKYRIGDERKKRRIRKRYGLILIKALGGNSELVGITGMSVKEAIRKLEKVPEVEYAEPNYIFEALSLYPNDEHFAGAMWNLHNTGQDGGKPGADVKALEAWELVYGEGDRRGKEVVVAILDSGIDYEHPDIVDNLWVNEDEIAGNGVDDDGNGYVDDIHGISTINNGGLRDTTGHGTHVAGIVGAVGNNGIGIAGVSWDVKILTCKLSGFGEIIASFSIVSCIDYVNMMKSRGVDIVAVNASWGNWGSSAYPRVVVEALERLMENGILFTAAAGNMSCSNDTAIDGNPPAVPASYPLPNIIAVAITDNRDRLHSMSCYGRYSVHMGAPGHNVVSLRAAGTNHFGGTDHFYPKGDVNAILYRATGTSMAAPHIAGAAALLKSRYPSFSWTQIKNRILAGGESLPALSKTTITGKRLDLFGALTCKGRKLISPWQFVRDQKDYRPGASMVLSAISIDCENPLGPVTVSVDGGTERIALSDDGKAPDYVKGDGVFTARWTPSNPDGHLLTFSSPAGSETVQVPAIPDPVITTLKYRGNQFNVGQKIVFEYLLENRGQGVSPAVDVGFFLSRDQVIDLDEDIRISRIVERGGKGLFSGGSRSISSQEEIPPIPPGRYYLAAVVDPDDKIIEGEEGEANNVYLSGQITITAGYADLSFVSVEGHRDPDREQRIWVKGIIRNEGERLNEKWLYVRYYLSKDETITPEDIYLGYQSFGRIRPGSSLTRESVLTVSPWRTPDGVYYLGGIIPVTSNESNPDNNVGVALRRVVVGDVESVEREPDLVLTSLSASSEGERISVAAEVENQGALGSGSARLELYLSTDSDITSDDFRIGSLALAPIAPKGRVSVTTDEAVAPAIPNGDYYVGGIVIAPDELSQRARKNNVSSGNRVTIGRSVPDLVPVELRYQLKGMGEVEITLTVENRGDGPAQMVPLGIYLSTDGTITQEDWLIAGKELGLLPAGGKITLSEVISVPEAVPNGIYYVGAVVNGERSIAESRWDNNTFSGTGTLSLERVRPDLVITAFSIPETVKRYFVFEATVSVSNRSMVPAGYSRVRFYLSGDAVFGPGDTEVTGDYGLYGIAESKTVPRTTALRIDSPPGNYYLLAVADADQNQEEENENNNVYAVPVVVQ